MRKILLLIFVSIVCIESKSQTKVFEQNPVTGDVAFFNKDRGTGGRVLVHDVNNLLVINYGNDFTGGVNIGSIARFRDKASTYQFDLSASPLGGGMRIGIVGDVGNKNVPLGGIAAQLNLDFTGYRDASVDQVGARIAALRFNVHQANNALVQSTGLAFYTNSSGMNNGTADLHERMRIMPNGNVGIGTSNPQNTLDVNGTIHTKEVRIDNDGWADFVFDKDYKLVTLAEIEAHIKEYRRLPEIPSEAEVKENGVDVGVMQVKLLQKIEELTLYVIEQDKKINKLQEENQELKKIIKQ